jgi:diaminohydroxyphosphoribosylaminopyrimidine deaminase / 5-amino-6-(5-phosphoribosylamino)uracil reductase
MTESRSLTKRSESDNHFMSIALGLADDVKGRTFPNPSVGAVIVKNNEIIGTGATAECGGPHAEINALKKAGTRSRGATMYVTLEPCCHYGRTDPCTDAIIHSGIRKVIVTTKDPNPRVNGRGIELLRKNGITVVTGIREKDAVRINEDFIFWITHHRPWVSIKLAMTLDGRIADGTGNSKWITSTAARKFVHDIRRRHAAIAIGAATLVKDNPKLTVRYGFHGNPVHFVFSSRETVPYESYFATSVDPKKHAGKKVQRSVLVVSGGSRSKRMGKNGIELWRTGVQDMTDSLPVFLSMAGEENICSVLVEGGGRLASYFLENKLANRLYLFYGNKIIGSGIMGTSFANGLPVAHPIVLDKIELQCFENDIMVSGIPRWS